MQFVSGGKWANTYLDAAGRVLLRAEEEGAVDERVPVEDEHRVLAEDARDAALLVLGERRQYEQSGLVVAMIPFVFNLPPKRRRKGTLVRSGSLLEVCKIVQFVGSFESVSLSLQSAICRFVCVPFAFSIFIFQMTVIKLINSFRLALRRGATGMYCGLLGRRRMNCSSLIRVRAVCRLLVTFRNLSFSPNCDSFIVHLAIW